MNANRKPLKTWAELAWLLVGLAVMFGPLGYIVTVGGAG